MNSNVERKFVNLRKRLDQLGYRHPLAIESLPLVEKLFCDLIHTTESLRSAKLSAGKTAKESKNFDALLEPYKTENARLVRENNELHLDLLKLKEDKDKLISELKTHVRKLDHETTDLKFLNNQYVHKVRCLEKDSKAKAERIQQLQEKNMQAVVQTPGGSKRSIPFRRQRMQIDDLLPSSSSRAYPVPQPDDPYVADMLLLADGRIHELEENVIKLKLDLENCDETIQHLNTQVKDRDKEIDRLNRLLHGGRPHDVISLEAQNVSNDKMIAHLNLQIEYLQEANRDLEQKVQGLHHKKRQASSEVADLSLKNLELCEELTHIDDLAKKLEMDKDLVLETADQELQESKEEIQKLRNVIGDLENIITKLRTEQFDAEVEKDRCERSYRDLLLELEAMRTKYGVCGRERSPSRLDAFVKSLEEEKDFYRLEAQKYKRLRGDTSPIRSPVRGRSPKRGGFEEDEVRRLVKERDELRGALSDFERHVEDIQNNVETLTSERDQLKVQLKQAQEELKITRRRDSIGIMDLEDDMNEAELKIQQITSERNSLLDRLKAAQTAAINDRHEDEKKIFDLENTVKMLERDRLDLRTQVSLLKESKAAVEEELKARCAALVQNTEEAVKQKAEASALRLLQDQMERSLSDTQRRLTVKNNELQATREQMNRMEERMAELSQQSLRHKEEVSLLQRSISALDREKDVLQDELDQKTERLVVLQDELNKKERTLEEVRLTVINMDNSMAHLEGDLKGREREVSSLRQQLDSSQEEVVELKRDRDITVRENRRLQDDLSTMTRENQAVHGELEQALHETDELKLRVHSYINEVARVEKVIAAKEQENRELVERFKMAHTDLEEQAQKLKQAEGVNNSIRMELLSTDTERKHLRETVINQQREINQHMQALQAYEGQVSSLIRNISRLEEELHKAQEEKSALVSDLASVRELCVKLDSGKVLTARQLTSKSMDLERITGELEDVRSETELLKKQLTSERTTVSNLESLLSTNRQKEFRTQLAASERDSELKVLRDRLALADSRNAEHTREVSQLRNKVSQLQAEMDVLKRQLTSERFERERAVQEMRKQGLSFSSLRSSSPHSVPSTSRHVSPDRSVLRGLDRSLDQTQDRFNASTSTDMGVSFQM